MGGVGLPILRIIKGTEAQMHRLMKQNSEPEIDPTEMPKYKSYSMKNK